ncbi:flagellar biosynthesis anti-sigma factor FlgM [uncultured Shewanella sp.]|uniref:flagellar biosynthesis anti-sigma factor FlgM n=1 Tax=uncultured Shewanella sp. TaxID=173975 RepID=UPI00261D936D|nr:flagellar biosynthesis anti-sigma factor FlgM [uncultured Shewanella sp.]
MAIDIKSTLSNSNTLSPLSGPQNTDPKAQTLAQHPRTVSSDSVSITPQAQQVQGAQSSLAQLPEMDMEKVAAIKLAISEGHYKVDPEKLANNIANLESEFAQKLNDI